MSVRMPADKTARVRRHLHALPLSGEVPDRINVVLADARKHLVDKHTPDNWIVVHSARSLATWKQTLAVLCANTLQQMMRRLKKYVGTCEACGHRPKVLYTAHRHGHGRARLCAQAIDANTYVENGVAVVNYTGAIRTLFDLHHDDTCRPLFFLCHDCHVLYDRRTTAVPI
jgi:hypothetical protein